VRQSVLYEQVVNGGKRPNWELQRPSENNRHRDARTSRRRPTGKNEETASVIRTALGGTKYPAFLATRVSPFLIKAKTPSSRHREQHPLRSAIYGFTFDYNNCVLVLSTYSEPKSKRRTLILGVAFVVCCIATCKNCPRARAVHPAFLLLLLRHKQNLAKASTIISTQSHISTTANYAYLELIYSRSRAACSADLTARKSHQPFNSGPSRPESKLRLRALSTLDY